MAYQILLGNCLDHLRAFPENAFEVTITSPPYNMNLRIRNGKYCRRTDKSFSAKYNHYNDDMPLDEFLLFHHTVLGELIRTSGIVFYNIAVVTGSKRAFFKMIGDYCDYLKDIIIWDKGHGQPAMHDGVLNRQSELILVFDKTNAISREFSYYNWARGTLSDTWQIKRERSKVPGHRAVFPEALVEKILLNFTKEGDTVYDPFMGSGTVLRVGTRLGRNVVGSELSAEYFEHY